MNHKRLAAFLALVIAASYFLGSCRKPQNSILAITHVTVIDMAGASPAPDQTVLIEKEKIIALGPSRSILIPTGANILDAHGKFLIPGLSDMHAALIAEFREQQTWQTPTLVLLRNVAFPSADGNLISDPRTKYVPHKLLATWNESYTQQIKGATSAQFSMRKALLEQSLGIVGQMQRGGVKILAGTDSAAPFVFPGSSLHEELALFVQAGLTPMEALQTATRNPAEFLGRLDSQGTITVGKNADLILLDANPLHDIHNTQKIRGVILRGKLLDRSALDQLLAETTKSATGN